MSSRPKITNLTLGQRNTLKLIQIIDLRPNLVESDKLYHNPLVLLQSSHIGFRIVLNLVNLFLNLLTLCLHFIFLFLFLFLLLLFLPSTLLLQLLLITSQTLINILRMMQLFGPKIPLKQRRFKFIPKFNLLKL